MDHIKLTNEPLCISTINELITSEDCGALSYFVGTTRNHFQGRHVLRLEYEAYNEMAEKEMMKLCKQARNNWSLKHVALHHRLGVVPVKEASVIVAASSEHRKESLEAVSFLIDGIKTSVPIWKKEIYDDGKGDWKENKECTWSKS
ncbi:unnamed protein product, partial [Meganyctiphanes norvegica]